MPSAAQNSAMPCSPPVQRAAPGRQPAASLAVEVDERRRRGAARTAGPIPRSTRGSRRRSSRGRRSPGRAGALAAASSMPKHGGMRIAVARHRRCRRETPRRRCCSRRARRGATAAPRCRRRRRGRRRSSPRAAAAAPAPAGGGCRKGRSVGGRSAHRGSAGANRGGRRVWHGPSTRRRRRRSVRHRGPRPPDSASAALPIAPAPPRPRR